MAFLLHILEVMGWNFKPAIA